MSVRLVGINHIAFVVRNLDEALDWYGRFFDVTLRGRRSGMAWIDIGDQFIALTEGEPGGGDQARHVGVVVSDKEALRAALRAAGLPVADSGGLRARDPSGNLLEFVDYRAVQFTKDEAVLRGMGLTGLEKSDEAREELRAKGLS